METQEQTGSAREIVSQANIERLITAICYAAEELGCNSIEIAQACRAVQVSAMSLMGGKLSPK